MPIDIQGPDGQRYRFPDGTTDDVMLAAMRNVYGGPTAAPSAQAPEPQVREGSTQGITGIPDNQPDIPLVPRQIPVDMSAIAPTVGVGEGLMMRARAGIGQAMGGVQQMFGEQVGGLVDAGMAPFQAVHKAVTGADLPNPVGRGLADSAAEGAGVVEQARIESKEAQAGTAAPSSLAAAIGNPGNALRYYGGLMAESAPMMAAAMATRNPAVATTLMGAGTAGQTYGAERADGATPLEAAQQAVMSGGMESALGLGPFEKAMGAGSLPRRMLTAGATEATTEGTTGVGQQIASDAMKGRDTSRADINRAVIDSTIVGGGMGAGMAVLGSGRSDAAAENIGPRGGLMSDAIQRQAFRDFEGQLNDALTPTARPAPRTPTEAGANAAEDALAQARSRRKAAGDFTDTPEDMAANLVATQARLAAKKAQAEQPLLADDAQIDAMLAPPTMQPKEPVASDLSDVSDIPFQQAGDVGLAGQLSQGQMSPDDWAKLKAAGLVQRGVTEPDEDGETREYEYVPAAALMFERDRRYEAARAAARRESSSSTPPGTPAERRAAVYDRLATEAEAAGNPTLAAQHRQSATVLRSRVEPTPTESAPDGRGRGTLEGGAGSPTVGLGGDVVAPAPAIAADAGADGNAAPTVAPEATGTVTTGFTENFGDELALAEAEGLITPDERRSLEAQRGKSNEQPSPVQAPVPATRSELSADQDHRTISGAVPEPSWTTSTYVRAAGGTPQVVFRGSRDGTTSPEAFDQLGASTGNPSASLGVWFSDDNADAARYGTVGEYHLDLRNPKEYDAAEFPELDSAEEAAQLREELKAQGYDGIMLDARPYGGPVQYVAFSPDQIINPRSKVYSDTSPILEENTPHERPASDPGQLAPELGRLGEVGPQDQPGRMGGSDQGAGRGSATAEPVPTQDQITPAAAGAAAPGEVTRGLSVPVLERLARSLFAGWANAPTVRVEAKSPDGKIEGRFDPATNTVTLYADALSSPARARWVAYHEATGHYGIRGALEGMGKGLGSFDRQLGRVRSNPTIDALARAIAFDRELDATNGRALNLATEEAMAELSAAEETGNWQHLNDRYGVTVPRSMRAGVLAELSRYWQAIKTLFAAIGRTGTDAFTDADWRELVAGARRYVRKKPEPKAEPEPENFDVDLEFDVDVDGETVKATGNAQRMLDLAQKRIDNLTRLAECIAA